MKVLIDDGMQISVGTGIGKYSEYLIKYLRKTEEYDCVDQISYVPKYKNKTLERIRYLAYINSHKFKAICDNYDIVHFTNYAVPIFKNKKTKYIVTIHDITAFLFPKTLPKAYMLYSRLVISLALKTADKIVTVSKSVKEEICTKWPQYGDKIDVAYIGRLNEYTICKSEKGLEYDNVKLRSLKKRKFFLFVGTIESRKNIGIVIDAFLNQKNQGQLQDIDLVLAGRPGFGYESYEAKIQESKYEKSIITTGYISSSDISLLYDNALAYIFPSVYEGFGIPQIDCMSHRLPIICSDIPTNREISGEYGLFFSLSDTKELEEQMLKLSIGEYDYEEKNKCADEAMKKYDWNEVVYDYIRIYNS